MLENIEHLNEIYFIYFSLDKFIQKGQKSSMTKKGKFLIKDARANII